jgi:hypothetical protein
VNAQRQSSALSERLELSAHRAATATPFAELVRDLSETLGKKLTAYLAGVKDTRAIERWISGAEPYKGAGERLRRAYAVALTLGARDRPRVVRAWFTGLNPKLDDRSPIRLLAEGTEDEARSVLSAARAFRAGR